MSSINNSAFLLIIEYNGAKFSGWQAQPGRRTVQLELEKALWKLFKSPVTLTVTGRTDAGVHAVSQAVSFISSSKIPAGNIHQALNALLPRDISVRCVRRMPQGFNVRRDARQKEYEYHIWNRPYRSVWRGADAWHVKMPLDINAMRKAARLLCGRHDFSAFDAKRSTITNKTARLLSIRVSSKAGKVTINFTGDRFLYKMVRNIVGTLVDVGLGKTKPEIVSGVLRMKKRSLAGPTAPAGGLFLKKISFLT